jgi:hypothetical protein
MVPVRFQFLVNFSYSWSLLGICLGLLLISGEIKVQVPVLIVGLLLISARYVFPQVDRVKENVNDV